ncbi:uncharacterized protein BDZ99DRAFT_505602 [Mytilinidion resinicola]|uniref:LysM domain-containing protein n=1 Tax=Mytilinidion resinicola TaxID=574789 RepID=A0A6A6Z4H1_9PEZI|nr:uncharacterized protein BDZ99DRAFT_505602 [Mytilinidion resinicola]KAF2816042.1 hypothetical protein BDZ99DRAFT_505602 [Mytilinidion resinicola]
MSSEACCTCAAFLSSIPPTYDEKTEKPALYERRLECCNRAICARCITDNARFSTYCPYCQVSIVPTSLPQGLRDPPPYSPPTSPELSQSARAGQSIQEELPAYSVLNAIHPPSEKSGSSDEHAPDVLHFIDPSNDTIASLSLRYGVPAGALRTTNGLYADHLLAARRTVLIPGEFYKGGVSLSPRPLEGEEEESRKGKVRKWMVACKVAEYDIALLYLKQSDYDLELAIAAYKEDEKWEAANPLQVAKKGKSPASQAPPRRRWGIGGSGGGLSSQIS